MAFEEILLSESKFKWSRITSVVQDNKILEIVFEFRSETFQLYDNNLNIH